jgi:multidrug efflux system outer membrane protein
MPSAAANLLVALAVGRIAAADLFPRVSIAGFLGLLAGRGNLFGRADSRAWAVTPALSCGRIRPGQRSAA